MSRMKQKRTLTEWGKQETRTRSILEALRIHSEVICSNMESSTESIRPRRSSRIAPDGSSSSFFSPRLKPEADSDELSLRSGTPVHLTKETTRNYLPPWTEPYIIGIAGYSGSGKTSIAQKIIQELNQPWTVLLSFDNFYNPLSPEERQRAFANEFDFDTPDSLDLKLLEECVRSLKNGYKTEIPVYSFAHHDRTSKTTTIYGANVIIIEGIYALYPKELLEMMDIKIFIDTDLDICLCRRLSRDILSRGRDLEGVMKQWNGFVKPNAVRHVKATMQNADLIIPSETNNSIAINMMIKHIQKQLSIKSNLHLKYLQQLGKDFGGNSDPYTSKHVKLLQNSNQLNGIHTIILDRATPRSDFIFYFDRIGIILINKALEFMNYTEKEITTPGNYKYKVQSPADNVVAVCMIRSGDCFMNSIKKSFTEISIGKLLIQSDSLTGEPQLHTESLPSTVGEANNKILLFDAQIISGAAAIMAIQVLLDHGVKPENIILVAYLSSEIGVRRILNAFGTVNIVIGKLSSMVADEDKVDQQQDLDTDWWFRNRFIDANYFGT